MRMYCAWYNLNSVSVGRVVSCTDKGVQGLESKDGCASNAKRGRIMDPLRIEVIGLSIVRRGRTLQRMHQQLLLVIATGPHSVAQVQH